MKKISAFLILMLLFSSICPSVAQDVVKGRYPQKKGPWVTVKYYKDNKEDEITRIEYDKKELTKLINDLNNDIKAKQREIDRLNKSLKLNQDKSQSQPQIQSPKTEDSLLRQQNNALLENKWKLEDSLKSLQGTVGILEDSVRFLNASLDNVNKQLASLLQKPTTPSGTFQHVGAYYRLGSPINFFNQKDTLGNKFWNRQKITLSHQIGLYWNSASFSDKLPMMYGAGLEYNRMRFSAGIIGQLEENPFDTTDIDGDHYTAYYSYNNVAESATLRYLSIPLSFSIGTPRADRICGYFQVSIVPSFLIHSKLSASGVYSCAGLYDTISGSPVTLYLDDFSSLGFGSDLQAKKPNKEDVLWPFMLSGRIAGGVYIPLCNTAKGQTSPWVIKVGVNLDMGFFFSKQKKAEHPNAKYHLDQYNILTGSGRWYFNPGLEIGILYMFNI